MVERMRAELLAAMAQRSWPVTFSVGLATFSQPPETADEVLRVADDLMLEAKTMGKNSIAASHR